MSGVRPRKPCSPRLITPSRVRRSGPSTTTFRREFSQSGGAQLPFVTVSKPLTSFPQPIASQDCLHLMFMEIALVDSVRSWTCPASAQCAREARTPGRMLTVPDLMHRAGSGAHRFDGRAVHFYYLMPRDCANMLTCLLPLAQVRYSRSTASTATILDAATTYASSSIRDYIARSVHPPPSATRSFGAWTSTPLRCWPRGLEPALERMFESPPFPTGT